MKINCYKYQGAGNDFVIIDNRDDSVRLNQKQVALLCDRRFGIGGDGLMLLESSPKYDFRMRYFNSDGYEGTMCGNGGRCLVAFAHKMGLNSFYFEAIDGEHIAEVIAEHGNISTVRLQIIDVDKTTKYRDDIWFINTGSPHLIIFVSDLKNYPVSIDGEIWRHHKDFPGGTNVNFVELFENHIAVRTFERGVEAETYACGTGVTASAIATYLKTIETNRDKETGTASYPIKALGGDLRVDFKIHDNSKKFKEIFLTGPATFVFETQIEI